MGVVVWGELEERLIPPDYTGKQRASVATHGEGEGFCFVTAFWGNQKASSNISRPTKASFNLGSDALFLSTLRRA